MTPPDLQWLPDGRNLALKETYSDFWIRSLDTSLPGADAARNSRLIAHVKIAGLIGEVALSRDGLTLFEQRGGNPTNLDHLSLVEISVRDGRVIRTLTYSHQDVTASLVPDSSGRYLLFNHSWDNHADRVDLATGKIRELKLAGYDDQSRTITTLAW